MRKVRVGIIGCGMIAQVYLENISTLYNNTLEVVAVADMFGEKAEEAAKRFGVARACTPEELIRDPKVEIVVNLTIPAAHTEVNLAALNQGKHVYTEKPLALDLEEAKREIALAKQKGLMLSSAPDTFLGAGLQTCRKLLDEGAIGSPLGATANLVSHGHECWHPNPEFLYKKGAGPMLDMGPYYVTALISLLGAVKRVDCYAKTNYPKRVITSQPLAGKEIDVEVFTNYTSILEFDSGVTANFNMSFDIWLSRLPLLEIYGTEGTLILPDPNMFGGKVKLARGKRMLDSITGLTGYEAADKLHSEEMLGVIEDIPLSYPQPKANMRGIGLVDMAYALVNGRSHRASEDLVYHALETLLSFDASAYQQKTYYLKSTCARPAAMPQGLGVGELDN